MSDTQEKKFEPIEASADGKRNAFSSHCAVVTQMMSYPACLWRQNVLAAPDIRTPADWSPCADARRTGRCNALSMRQEEELKGHAIYFVERGLVRRTLDAAREWGTSTLDKFVSKTVAAPAKPAPAPAPRKADSMLDVMGETSYADAINLAAATPAPTPTTAAPAPVAPKPASVPPMTLAMQPGESPLAYARRLKAAQTATAGA